MIILPTGSAPLSQRFLKAFALDTTQVRKVVAVALASFAFSALQGGLPLAVATAFTFLNVSGTLIAEIARNYHELPSTDWFSTDHINWDWLFIGTAGSLLRPIFSAIRAPLDSKQHVAKLILSGDLRTIFMATVIAPIAEEILFRGLIQENIELMLSVVSRKIYTIDPDTQMYIASAIQSLCFGLIHLTGSQVAGGTMIKIAIGVSLACSAAFYTLTKEVNRSLLFPMALHSANNTGFTLALFVSQALYGPTTKRI